MSLPELAQPDHTSGRAKRSQPENNPCFTSRNLNCNEMLSTVYPVRKERTRAVVSDRNDLRSRQFVDS